MLEKRYPCFPLILTLDPSWTLCVQSLWPWSSLSLYVFLLCWEDSCCVVCDLYGNVQYLLFIVFHCNLVLQNKKYQEPWNLLSNQKGIILKKSIYESLHLHRIIIFNTKVKISQYTWILYFCHFPDPSLCCFYPYQCSRKIIRLLQLCNPALNVIVDSSKRSC